MPFRLFIVLCLGMPQGIILPIGIPNQRFVVALLYNMPLVKDQNFVAEFAGGQPVADIYGGSVTGNIVEFAIDIRFCQRIQCSRGFIENEQNRH